MITDDEVMRLFERADPARTIDNHDDTPDAAGYLAALRLRSNHVTYIHPTDNSTDESSRRPFTLLAIAAAAVVVIVVGALVFAARSEDDGLEVPATLPPTTTNQTTTDPAPQVDDPIGRAADFLAAFVAGEPAAVTALQADDFVMRYGWSGEPSELVAEHEWLGVTYQAGHATNYADPTCTSVDEVDGVAVVECETAMELAVHQAANADGLGVTLTLRVSDDGVVAMESEYVRSFTVLRPFDEWREANRPDALPDDDSSDPQTEAAALAFARTEAQLAEEWATLAVAAVERVLTGYHDVVREEFPEAPQPERFLDLFAPGVDVLGVEATLAPDAIEALMTSGVRYEPTNCGTAGITSRGLAVRCDITVLVPSLESTGIVLDGSFTMVVGPDGRITSSTDTVNWDTLHDVNDAFEQWLAGEHPRVHDGVVWVDIGRSPIASGRPDDQSVIAQYVDEFLAQSGVYPVEE